ncbi:MAG: CAP domain-containing protein [Pseudomonadota bacterium]
MSAGCASSPPKLQVQEKLSQGAFRSEVAPAVQYDVRQAVELDGVEQKFFVALDEVAKSSGKKPLVAELAMQRTANDICRGWPRVGPPASALLGFVLRNHGLVEPAPHLMIADVEPGTEDQIAAELGHRFKTLLTSNAFARVGIAVCKEGSLAQSGGKVVVVLFENSVSFAPFPRVLNLGQKVQLSLSVANGYKLVQLVVADPYGELAIVSAETFPLVCERRGTYQVEVLAKGRFGREVLANFPVYCGEQPPSEIEYEFDRPKLSSVIELERELVESTNELRRSAGLRPLKVNEKLVMLAREHSKDMLEKNFVGHESPAKGGPVERFRREQFSFLVLRENVARSYSVAEAMMELMNSPVHRQNLLSRDVTEMGVGVAIDRQDSVPVLLVTQNFVDPPRR